MLHEFVDVKKAFSKEEIGVKCSAFAADLKEPIRLLDVHVKETQAVMRARAAVNMPKGQPAKKKPKKA